MSTELAIAFISSGVAAAASVIAVWGQLRVQQLTADLSHKARQNDRRHDAAQLASIYKEPLARSIFELQSRLFNILRKGLLGAYGTHGEDVERGYVVESTTFLFCQLFCWFEIIRRNVQHIDLETENDIRELLLLQTKIRSLLQTDDFSDALRVFSLEQRAIGERMIVQSDDEKVCMGYADFIDYLSSDRDPRVGQLHEQVKDLLVSSARAEQRLTLLHGALIDLLDFLDPRYLRFLKEERSRIA